MNAFFAPLAAGGFLRRARASLALGFIIVFAGLLPAAETIPPAPREYFNDYAGVVSAATARTLNARLAGHERATSSQIVVAIYPRLSSDSSVEDFTVRVAQAWRVGQKARNNGAVLFAFMQERQLYLQVGYGLEGAIPDALAKRIIADELVPRLRAGQPDAAFNAGVDAILAATRGEYTSTGRTRAENQPVKNNTGPGAFIVLIIIALIISRFRRSSTVYTGTGRRHVWINPGGGFSGGRGGGGGFSGGGGGFGGGGAGGRW